MKLALLLTLFVSLAASAQTASPTATQESQVGAPAAGEASMTNESKPEKKHKKTKAAHHAKAKKHHKKKKHHSPAN